MVYSFNFGDVFYGDITYATDYNLWFYNFKVIIQELQEHSNPIGIKEWWMEFLAVSTRLFTNPIFMLNLFSAVFIVMANTGFYTFLPKYFEFAFRQKASTAAAAAGAASCLASTTGLISAGYVIKRWQPSARSLSAWMIATTLMGVIGSLSLLVIGCPSLDIHGMSSEFDDTRGTQIFPNGTTLKCNNGCVCNKQRFSPICSADGSITYFSPCHAGCSDIKEINIDPVTELPLDKSVKIYRRCSCVKNNNSIFEGLENDSPELWSKNLNLRGLSSIPTVFLENEGDFSQLAIEGYCPSNCQQQFYILVLVGILISSMSATGLLPSTLINMRAIKRIDKSASIALSVGILSALSILPAPIIFGALYDSTCTIWGEKCGETLNCLVYDTDKLRTGLAHLVASLISVALIGYCGVFYFVKNLQIYEVAVEEPTKISDNV